MTSFLQEELAKAAADRMLQAIARLPPISRLRILAFLHLLEKPEAVRAGLDIDQSGTLKLTLSALERSARSSRH